MSFNLSDPGVSERIDIVDQRLYMSATGYSCVRLDHIFRVIPEGSIVTDDIDPFLKIDIPFDLSIVSCANQLVSPISAEPVEFKIQRSL